MTCSRKMFLFLTIITLTVQSHAVVNLKTALACYADLGEGQVRANTTQSGSLFAAGDETVIVPSTLPAKKGFYLYTNQSAYFCKLPDQASYREGAFDRHYLELELPDRNRSRLDNLIHTFHDRVPTSGSRYLTYEDPGLPGALPQVLVEEKISQTKRSEHSYVKANCVAELSDDTKNILATEIEKKIQAGYREKWSEETRKKCDHVSAHFGSSGPIDFTLRNAIACYGQITGNTSNNHLLANGSVLVPYHKPAANKRDKDVSGFYVYGKDKTYFCEHSAKPKGWGPGKKMTAIHDYRLNLPAQGPIWMTYTEQSSYPSEPVIWKTTQPENKTYTDANCKLDTSGAAHTVLIEKIKSRMAEDPNKSVKNDCEYAIKGKIIISPVPTGSDRKNAVPKSINFNR